MELVNFEVMQQEVGEWAQRNFGGQPAVNPLVGMIEELCEVEIASVEALRTELSKEIGDVMIYMAHFCHLRNWSLLEAWDGRFLPDGCRRGMQLIHCILWLSKHYLKGYQNIRGGTNVHDAALKVSLSFICHTLEQYAESAGLVVLDSIGQRWETIKRRDWVKNPDTAAAVIDAIISAAAPHQHLVAAAVGHKPPMSYAAEMTAMPDEQVISFLDAAYSMADLGKHVDMESPVQQPSWMKAMNEATQREMDKAILGPEFVTEGKEVDSAFIRAQVAAEKRWGNSGNE